MTRKYFNPLLILIILIDAFLQSVLSINADFPRTSEDLNALFIEHKIVPDVIPLSPEHILRVEYKLTDVDFGNLVHPFDMLDKPKSVYWPVDREEYYTLVMTDPDAPSAEDPYQREWQHWIVVNIPETSVSRGEELSEYIGQVAYQINSLHRYVFLVYKHPMRRRLPFDEQHLSQVPVDELRANFSVFKFAEKYNLGRPFAGNFCYGRWNASLEQTTTQRTRHPFDTWDH